VELNSKEYEMDYLTLKPFEKEVDLFSMNWDLKNFSKSYAKHKFIN
jgi:hypothetical protein